MADDPLRIFMVAGEHSGDQLGGKLVQALRRLSADPIEFNGVGGEAMVAAGCPSLFPLSDIAVMGLFDIGRNLPRILLRLSATVQAATAVQPDALVIIDSPEFTHSVAKRLRRRFPTLPVADYVSPTVWAWRPGRARRMCAYIDHVLAILPFEPEVHRRLGGPACSYVGHALVERARWMRGLDPTALTRKLGLDADRPTLVVLPGSRSHEIRLMMPVYGKAIALLAKEIESLQVVLPAVESVRPMIEYALQSWPVRPQLVRGEEDKFKAFRLARAALATSGTVTLELALAGTPMVVAYRYDKIMHVLDPFVSYQSIVLPNLVLGDNIFPEFVQTKCRPERLAAALKPLMLGGPERDRQRQGMETLLAKMKLPMGTPSEAAAKIVLELARQGRDQRLSMGTYGRSVGPV